MRKKDEQRHRNRTCRFAIGSLQQYAIKTTSECPKAEPVMGSKEQGNFYAVEKEQCRNCEFYVQDDDKEAKYREERSKYWKNKPSEKKPKIVKGQKTKYTW